MKINSHNQPVIKRCLNWLKHPSQSLHDSLRRIAISPLAFIFTVSMIAIAFSIPISGYIFFMSVKQLTQAWDGDKQITLFLKKDITLIQATELAKTVSRLAAVETAIAVDKKHVLEDFKTQTGLESITDNLSSNPLPHIIIATPAGGLNKPGQLKSLRENLKNYRQVEQVQFDLIWYQRLQAILVIIKRIQSLVTIFLLTAIALIITNVIRWEVSSRHAEIEIIKLVGATDAYVRRPFLYAGLWLGLTGALLAIIMVAVSRWLIQHSSQALSALLDNQLQLAALPVSALLLILICAGLLGVASAWFAVSNKLGAYN